MAERKYIIIGEASLDIDFTSADTATARPGGIFLNTATALAGKGLPTMFISEIGIDQAGRFIASALENAGVDISCSDRFAGANTPLRLSIDNKTSRYQQWTDTEGLDISWPRIERDDIVVFGGFMSIDQRVRARLWALIANAIERKATVVYIPGVNDQRITRITRVMPIVFENLEAASLVVTLPDDLQALYGSPDPEKAYSNNISFYSRAMAAIETTPDGSATCASFGTAPAVGPTKEITDTIVQLLSEL